MQVWGQLLQRFGLVARAINEANISHAGAPQSGDNGTRRAARAEHQSRMVAPVLAVLAINAASCGIKTGDEAVTVRIVAAQLAVFKTDCIDRAQALSRRAQLIHRRKGRMLMRHGDISAEIAGCRHGLEGGAKIIFRVDGIGFI